MAKKVVVCGGGLMGLHTAYHLANRGVSVMLFEKKWIGEHNPTRITTGFLTTPSFFADVSMQYVARRSFHMYEELSKDGEFHINHCGRVYFAKGNESEMHIKQILTRLSAYQEPYEIIRKNTEMQNKWPMVFSDDLSMAVVSHQDAIIDVNVLCDCLVRTCRRLGVQIYEGCDIKKVLVNDKGRVYGVDTDEGLVETSVFINCGGIWANSIDVPDIDDSGGVGSPRKTCPIPAHPCCFTFLSTNKLPQIYDGTIFPLFVDLDASTYAYPTDLKTICGGFSEEKDLEALSISAPEGETSWTVPATNWDKFLSVLKRIIHRFPTIAKLPPGDLICTPEMYTPDMFPIIGELPPLRGYYVANGLNGQGVTLIGGLSEILANWICGHSMPISLSKLDVARFLPMHSNPEFLFQRVPEIASNTFKPITYTYQCHTARNLRTSPLYHQFRANGAIFGENTGYERPLWYDPRGLQSSNNKQMISDSLHIDQDRLLGKPKWFDFVSMEYDACRERVGLIDMTSFSKFDVQGPDAVQFLQRLCSANIDRPVGSTIYSGMQNENGGYVTDLTLSRMRSNAYFLVAPTIQRVRLNTWLRRWAVDLDMDVRVQDVTNSFTALNIVGPSSRELMKDITGMPMTQSDFPSFTFKELNIGLSYGIRAISVSHCGELGWVLYIPNEAAQILYELLCESGTEYSMKHCGYYALRTLRIEKFYVYWGQDIDEQTTPNECGRAFRVDFNKEFIGKDALLRQNEHGVRKRFVQLLIDRHNQEKDPWPQGNEPIFNDGDFVGWTTSTAYGFTLGSQICLGYIASDTPEKLAPEHVLSTSYEIEIAQKRFQCRLNLHSPSLPMISSEHPNHYRPTQ